MSFMIGFLVSSVFFIYALSILLENSIFAYKSMSSRNWPTTMGKIQSLSLQKKTLEFQCPTIHYKVKCTYDYYLHGEMYVGSQIAFGYYGGDNLRYQEAIMKKLRSSSTIIVRYNSKDPKISTLSFGIHHSIKQSIVVAFMMLGFFMMLCLSSIDPIALLYGLVVFICGFIIHIILGYRTDNTIIQNIKYKLQ
jgi:Protein of unknown function (DUF3592)